VVHAFSYIDVLYVSFLLKLLFPGFIFNLSYMEVFSVSPDDIPVFLASSWYVVLMLL
jgi:hypothetical protein